MCDYVCVHVCLHVYVCAPGLQTCALRKSYIFSRIMGRKNTNLYTTNGFQCILPLFLLKISSYSINYFYLVSLFSPK